MIHVLVWYENMPLPEAREAEHRIYPQGIHGLLGALFSAEPDMEVRMAVMQDPEQGLSDESLLWADVLVYFSHKHWREIAEDRVSAMQQRVLGGMGLILLHSSHASLIFSRLMGTRTPCLRWRENDEQQRVFTVMPSHPIASVLSGEFFTIPQDETYGEYFEIPAPDDLVFLTASSGGEVLRSGCCWYRGQGRIFYFASGHETYPVYYQKEVQSILLSAVRWAAAPRRSGWPDWAREVPPLK